MNLNSSRRPAKLAFGVSAVEPRFAKNQRKNRGLGKTAANWRGNCLNQRAKRIGVHFGSCRGVPAAAKYPKYSNQR